MSGGIDPVDGEPAVTELDGGDDWGAVAELGVDFVFDIDRDGTITAVSDDIERFLGEPPSSVVGDPFERFVRPADRGAAIEAFHRVLAGEGVRERTFALQGPDGPRWLELNADPVRAGGEVVAVRGAAREVTDRRERRRALERRSAAMESAIDGMAVLDEQGEYVYVNDAHAEMYGYDRAALLGTSWRAMYAPEERRRLAEGVLPETERTGAWRGEAVGRRRDGSTFRQELSLASLDDGGMVCVVRDVSERHRREEVVEVLDRVLRHNLRNEMNVVLGEAEAIERHADGRLADAADRIRATARNLLDTSETAREIRRTVSGDRPTGVVDLGEVAERCCRSLEDVVDCRPAVDGTEAALPVQDHGLDIVVRELLDNAVEHAGPDPEVSVRLDRVDGEPPQARLRVADDGPGLPEMERTVLAEGRETPLQHGQGLGLWLVHWTVTEAGGELSVHDRDPRGTVVEVCLPVVGEDGRARLDGTTPAREP